MTNPEIKAELRREQDILDRLDNVKRLIQMEYTLLTANGCELYRGYKNYVRKDDTAFGNHLINDLRNKIQLQLLSITALCYGDNPDIGEPMSMLSWNYDNSEQGHPEDRFREMWDSCLEWN